MIFHYLSMPCLFIHYLLMNIWVPFLSCWNNADIYNECINISSKILLLILLEVYRVRLLGLFGGFYFQFEKAACSCTGCTHFYSPTNSAVRIFTLSFKGLNFLCLLIFLYPRAIFDSCGDGGHV